MCVKQWIEVSSSILEANVYIMISGGFQCLICMKAIVETSHLVVHYGS